MPTIYLSPSTQDFNPSVLGRSEEQLMNAIADRMEPYLRSSGIGFVRNDPKMTAAQVIAQSNRGRYDLHLALHSNAAPEALSGQVRGSELYYAQNSLRGRSAAAALAEQLKTVYPDPGRVNLRPTRSLGEVTRTRAPAVLAELAYHDNKEDALWLQDHPEEIAKALVRGLCAHFRIPFLEPGPVTEGVVAVPRGGLNLRARPTKQGHVLAVLPRGARVTVLGDAGYGWALVQAGSRVGYAARYYIRP